MLPVESPDAEKQSGLPRRIFERVSGYDIAAKGLLALSGVMVATSLLLKSKEEFLAGLSTIGVGVLGFGELIPWLERQYVASLEINDSARDTEGREVDFTVPEFPLIQEPGNPSSDVR